jgi:hypothetical protein
MSNCIFINIIPFVYYVSDHIDSIKIHAIHPPTRHRWEVDISSERNIDILNENIIMQNEPYDNLYNAFVKCSYLNEHENLKIIDNNTQIIFPINYYSKKESIVLTYISETDQNRYISQIYLKPVNSKDILFNQISELEQNNVVLNNMVCDLQKRLEIMTDKINTLSKNVDNNSQSLTMDNIVTGIQESMASIGSEMGAEMVNMVSKKTDDILSKFEQKFSADYIKMINDKFIVMMGIINSTISKKIIEEMANNKKS